MTAHLAEIVRPSDWHHHFREGPAWLATTVPLCFSQFEYAVAMPNLTEPIVSQDRLHAYYRDILIAASAAGLNSQAKPCMTYYLNEQLNPADLVADPIVIGAKYYPRGATTNSQHGITSYTQVRRQLAAMENNGLVLMIHGEDHDVAPMEREAAFLKAGHIRRIMEEFQGLKMTLEHISTAYAVDYIRDVLGDKNGKLGATITPHHMTLTSAALGPRNHCCPCLKTGADVEALREWACSGSTSVFLGTDNAPHTDAAKLVASKPGVFNVHSALSSVIAIFHEGDRLNRLEGFISTNGCEWYSKPLPMKKAKIYECEARVPLKTKLAGGEEGEITPQRAGGLLAYRLA